ncbi:MAG: aldo/keto reductase [Alphaproteobacteria bacterium]|nr:aldo/keto reductase [Alphaproteobacteria bacterium]
MELRTLGSTGLRVSLLGLGTVRFGRSEGLKLAHPSTLPGDDEIDRLVGLALDLGVNLFDTAPAYGSSEERLGRALAGRRDGVVLCTKAGEAFAAGRSNFDFRPASIRASLEASLRRLRTDHADILLIHSDGIAEGPEKFGPAMAEVVALKARGLVRAAGFSCKTPEGGAMAAEALDLVMLTLNRADMSLAPLLDLLAARGKAALVKKPLDGGREPDPAAALRLLAGLPSVGAILVGTLSPTHLAEMATALA